MASSKKPRPAVKPSPSINTGPHDLAFFADVVQQALGLSAGLGKVPGVAIAYSGGADSTVLLHAVATLHQQGLLHAIALHVHHGLSPHSDDWLRHCAHEAATLHLPFYAEQVKLQVTGGQSIEAEARQARYAALQRLCAAHETPVLLTGHHADDQAETVLLNLLRGAGVAGLAGAARQRPLGTHTLLRPFQHLPATALRQLAQQQKWAFIEDESNHDRRFTRNALRHEVMPVLKRIFPAVTTRLAQTAAHSAEAQTLLDDIGREDLQQMQSGTLDASDTKADLHIEGLRLLSRPRAANALRVWFRTQARQTPSTAALKEMLDQLLESHSDAQISLIHDDLALQVYRGRVYARPVIEPSADSVLTQTLVWSGEAELDLTHLQEKWKGKLLFEVNAETGIPASMLSAGELSLRTRQGGERLKLYANRPSRSLKNLYQESAIPPWQRAQLPLLYVSDQLIFAAGLGMDTRHLVSRSALGASDESLVILSWQAE